MVSENSFNGNEKASKIERVKNLIFGDQINQYDQQFKEIFSKFELLEKKFELKLNTLEKKFEERNQLLEDKINNLSSSSVNDTKELKNNLETLKNEFLKEIDQLKVKSVDKSKFAKLLKNLTEE